MGPGDLRKVLQNLPKDFGGDVLIGFETGDDATVVQLTPEIAIVQSLDFFMPIVDDPFVFGMIAAANAISDIYAMGATPISALAILGFPLKKISAEVANQIMLGGAEICRSAGINISGGHSIDDTEPKFGLSVTGVIHPKEIWKNNSVQEGDFLVLTKPLGVGVFGSANKKGLLTSEQYENFVQTTTFLNEAPAKAARKVGVHAVTDVTGFGVLGHTLEMVNGTELSAELWVEKLPILEGTRTLLDQNVRPGATARNLKHVSPYTSYDDDISIQDREILADAQTSGGLLISVSASKLELLLKELEFQGSLCYNVVGQIQKPIVEGQQIIVRRSS